MKQMSASLLGLLVAITACRSATLNPAGSPAVIDAPAGKLEGTLQGDVQTFLGVPFAKAPVGRLRWREPQPLPRWPGVRKARAFGASCYQEWPAKGFGPFTAEFVETPEHSEDCLYLNVWRPAAAAPGLPIYFWIHGAPSAEIRSASPLPASRPARSQSLT